MSKGEIISFNEKEFGGDINKYNFWRPHMCAVCCLKMAGDAIDKTNNISLSLLLDKCLQGGVYKIDNNDVKGAFHFRLVKVMGELEIPAKVCKNINIDQIINKINDGKIIFLSIDLQKVKNSIYKESHLILIYNYSHIRNEFRIHDCSSILSPDGNGVFITNEELSIISNKRGLIVG